MSTKVTLRKLDLTSYKVEVSEAIGQITEIDYDMHWALRLWLTSSQLQLNGAGLLRNGDLCEKIKASEKFILLTEDEYNLLKNAISNLKGFTHHDIIAVKRVDECPQVPVEEAKKR